jgi:hypothetical protein
MEIDLNDFKKLIVYKVMRPDSYVIALNEYVNKSLNLKLEQPSWDFIFNNPIYKSIIINMGSQSNLSNSSSMSRIHKNFYKINQANGNSKVISLNCTFLSLEEIKADIREATEGFVLLKNIDSSSLEVIDYVKQLCQALNKSKEIKWRLILTKSFDFKLPESILYESLQVSFDTLDIMAHNSVEKNKKISIETCMVKDETLIFNCKKTYDIFIL